MLLKLVPDRRAWRPALRLAIIAAVLLAVLLVATQTRSGVWWRLVTFTYQVNVLAAGYYAWTLARTLARPAAESRAGLRGAVVLYVLVAGVIWNLFLTDLSMGYTPANVLLHMVVPALALADWFLVSDGQGELQWWFPVLWLAYPAGYLALAVLVLNHAGRRAPYYFLDVQAAGPVAVAANATILAAGFLALGYLLFGAGRMAVRLRV
ncbi:Pr6Pr family membrane protein [Mycolicibacterium palauense]|uniref:Pr6Pr family membrane protein n=1 Tax=Mycolicibacterium palauense TaxID=2034511 RepID=UPI000BFEEA20|nr:Pr6Pr family membrane protein [Mycolicibacterium palauense]